MSAILGLGEAIAKLLEPWPDVPGPVADANGVRMIEAASGTIVDLNMARPTKWEPNTLYVWPVQHEHANAGASFEERENFGFQFVYAVDRDSEEAKNQARRSVSAALDARAHSYSSAVAHNRSRYEAGTPAPWEQLETPSIDHQTAITFGVRGIGVRVTGYRHVHYD